MLLSQQKAAPVDSEHKQQLIARLRTIEGHIRGVQRMVAEDVYCMDILKQTRAIQRALHRLDSLMLEDHLNTCVTAALRSDADAERERVLHELMQVFDATKRT